MKVADANQSVPAGRIGPAQVLPLQSLIACSKPPQSTNRVTKLQLAEALFHWVVWSIMVLLVLSQFLSVFWSTVTMNSSNDFGQSPLKGPGSISGINDEPFSDRSLVCVLQGRSYLPVSVNDALLLGTARVVDMTGTSVNGYRVSKRAVNVLTSEAVAMYTHTCSVIAATLDALFERCTLLGYNVTRDHLRIVDDLESTTTFLIGNSLPILMMPFWDDSFTGRFVFPGSDGSACMFRLVAKYSEVTSTIPYLIAVSRTTREAKTAAWLNRPRGVWRNGWYEDLDGAKWHADMISNEKDSTLGIPLSQFDMLTGEELVCDDLMKCAAVILDSWGSKFSSARRAIARTSVIVSNGMHCGLFQYRAHLVNTATSIYGWETLVSNTLTIRILIRWLVAMATLHRGYFLRVSEWHNTGIGCLANFRTFDYLPLMLLPRLKMTLFAFWTSGCVFDGPQRALADTWFVMYPAICEFMLFYYSILNMVAKMLRCRVCDIFFGPTLIFLCLLHYLREELGQSGWLNINGQVPTVVLSPEFSDLRLFDFLTSGVALRLNGNISGLFATKLIVVAISILPLLVRWQNTSHRGKIGKRNAACDIEKALAIRAPFVGGLGCSDIYEASSTSNRQGVEVAASTLNSYKVVRLGYVVIGGKFLVSIADWHTLFILSPARYLRQPPNFRVTLFTIVEKQHDKATRVTIDDYPHVCRLNDPRLRSISVLDITARPFN